MTSHTTPPGRGRRRGTALGIGIIVLGVLAAAATFGWTILHLSRAVDALARVPYPSGGTITMKSAGHMVVYAEYAQSIGDGSPIPNAQIQILGPGGTVPMADYEARSTYTLGDRHGLAVATADIPAPGDYAVNITPTGDSNGVVGLAVGTSVTSAGGFVVPILAAIGLGAAGLIAGIIVIVRGRRRDRAGLRAQMAPPGMGAPPPPPPPGSPAGGPPPPPPAPPGGA